MKNYDNKIPLLIEKPKRTQININNDMIKIVIGAIIAIVGITIQELIRSTIITNIR